jgi:hypothetical protein
LCEVAVRRGDVNLTRLSVCQKEAAAGRYAEAMAGFIAHLAPRYGEIRSRLDAERAELRNQFVGRYPHARTPDVVANLLLGLRYFLEFTEEVGAVTQAEHKELWQRGEEAILAVVAQQSEHQRSTDPLACFPEMIATILSSGRGHIAGLDGKEPGIPPSPGAWGWTEVEVASSMGQARAEARPRGRKIGWVAGKELYLDPDATYAALSGLAQDQAQAYPSTKITLGQRLKEADLLLRVDGERTVYPVTVEGGRRRVWVLPVAYILGEPGQMGQPGQPAVAGDSQSAANKEEVAGHKARGPIGFEGPNADDVEVFEV